MADLVRAIEIRDEVRPAILRLPEREVDENGFERYIGIHKERCLVHMS